MRITPPLLLLIVLLTALSPSTQAQAPVTIIALDIHGLHQLDGQGSYDRILHKLLIQPGIAKIDVYPVSRAERNFEQCQRCCLSPANNQSEFYKFRNEVIETEPMNTAKVYIFVPKDQQPLSRLEQLRGLSVGARRGMPYGNSFEQAKLSIEYVTTLKQNIQLLEKGRIDAFIAYAPDIYQAFAKHGSPPFPHTPHQPVAVHPDGLVCRGVPNSFIERFNYGLNKLRTSGELKEILGSTYLEP